jgi:excalibur calcium-binding domain-containing protein
MSAKKIMARSAALVSVGAIGCGAIVGTAGAVPAPWKRCSLVNRVYPHGVGRAGAHDITRSSDPVTNFKQSTRLYNLAMHYNRGLDRDHDGIACEKH